MKTEEIKHEPIGKNETLIAPSDDLIDQPVPKIEEVKEPKKKETFGGLKAGFFNNPPPKKPKQ